MVSDNSSKIVKCWTDPSAPTGEGDRCRTEDGHVWKEVMYKNNGTGERYGTVINGYVEKIK